MRREAIIKNIKENELTDYGILTLDAALVVYGLLQEAAEIDVIICNPVLKDFVKDYNDAVFEDRSVKLLNTNVAYSERYVNNKIIDGVRVEVLRSIFQRYCYLYKITKKKYLYERIQMLKRIV